MTKRKKKGRNGQENKFLGWEGLEVAPDSRFLFSSKKKKKHNHFYIYPHTLTSKIIDYLLSIYDFATLTQIIYKKD